jgi:hypothetical protein
VVLIAWPPRSPDLILLGLLWEYTKDLVHHAKMQVAVEPRRRVTAASEKVPQVMLQTIW